MHRLSSWLIALLIITTLILSCSKERPKAEFPTIPFDRNENHSASYEESIGFYQLMAAQSPVVHFREIGPSDSGKPLHEVVITRGNSDPAGVRADGKVVIMINNGIHAGEPCGIDASMLLTRDLVRNAGQSDLLDKVAVVILPVYNIGGALQRNSHSRANQNGPEEYGFRGNAKNLDLNRDFIKSDSRNAQTFTRWLTRWSPELFFDTHTSNGADYQYVMTLIETQQDKLSAPLAEFMTRRVTPELYERMEKEGYPMTPYVYSRGIPDEGIYSFLDLPRYSTGLAALHHTIGYTSEAHMLKSFSERVRGTQLLLQAGIDVAAVERDRWMEARRKAKDSDMNMDSFDIDWNIDLDRRDSLKFLGYEAGYKKSEVTGMDRLYYDTDRPFEKTIPYWPHQKATRRAAVPEAYILPQAYHEVVERLQWNGVRMEPLRQDTALWVQYSYIESFRDGQGPYEGHYLHRDVTTREEEQLGRFHKGDWWIPTDQPAVRFLVNTLEPTAPDAYFAWNFFDGILMQKEYYSDYVFEDLAARYLREDDQLRQTFEEALRRDPSMRESSRRQLDFIYRHSPHYENTHRRYPVARIIKADKRTK